MERIYIGVDIGKAGSLSALNKDGAILEMIPMPKIGTEVDYPAVSSFLKKYKHRNPFVVFEKLQAIFKVGKSAAFSLGYQAGAIEMACVALELPYQKVQAKIWQAAMFSGVGDLRRPDGKRDTKGMALIAAQRLYPGVSFKKSSRAVLEHDGIIDAILMARWAKNNNL